MPSLIVQANTTAQSIAAARRNANVVPKSMVIDNDGGSGDRTIRIQDVFTPSETNGTAAPTEQTIDRGRWDVIQGDVLNLGELELKGIKCLGSLKIIADTIDTGCYITVGYEME